MIQLDNLDVKILEFLQENSRITMKEMAARLNSSTTPVFDRIKKLERNGVIAKYVALINPRKIDKKLIAFVSVSMKEHGKAALDAFSERIDAYAEIVECHHITGQADFLLKVITEDIESYNTFITERLSQIPDIAHVNSSFSLSTRKDINTYYLGGEVNN